MKKAFLLLLFVLLVNNLSAQKYSTGLSYSTLLNYNNNYKSAYVISVTGDYELLKDKISTGIDASLFLTENFMIDNLATFVNERSFNLAVNVKYYPFKLQIYDSLSVKPFLSVGIGRFLIHNMDIPGGTPSCSDLYKVSTDDYFNTYFSFGLVLFPEELNFIFDLKYLIRNPEITFDKPVCIDEVHGPKSYTKYSKKVNLNMLLLSIGVRINF